MKKEAVMLSVALIVAAIALGGFLGLFDVSLGEEGFTPYDPAWPSTYSPNLWGISGPNQELVSFSGNTITLRGLLDHPTLCSRPQSTKGPACGVITYQTRNVYLEEFRMDYTAKSPQSSGHCPQGAVLEIGGQVYRLSGADMCSNTGSLELRWNGYELGQWALYDTRAGFSSPVLTGTSSGDLRLTFSLEGNHITYGPGELTIKDPRVHALFSCDPQENEVITDACFGGPDVITQEDLPGFRSFCLDLPAIRDKGGVATADKRVYYELAADNPVIVSSGEIYKFQYIAAEDLSGKTGVSSNCELQVIDDTVDILDREELSGADVAIWSANYKNPTFRSGSRVLLQASTPTYSCQATDQHDPDGDVFMYPDPSSACYKALVNEKKAPATIDIWTLTPLDTQIRADYSETESGIVRNDNWNILYEVKLTKKPYTVAITTSDGLAQLDIENTYVPTKAIVQVTYRPQVIADPSIVTKEVDLSTGKNTIMVPLDERYTGTVTMHAVVFMQTEAGNLQASQEETATYDNEGGSIVAPIPPSTESVTESGIWAWLKEVWTWILSLFS